MPSKIAFLTKEISPHLLCAHIADTENLEMVVAVVRIDGHWRTTWSNGGDTASLSMAALKLMADIQDKMHGMDSTWSPPEKESA